MRKIFSLLFPTIICLMTFKSVNSQTPQYTSVNVCLGTDAVACTGTYPISPQQVIINDCGAGGGGTIGNVLNLPSPSTVSLSDDSWSGAIPIGFTFNYYGTNYTQCVIGSNGIVSFKLSNAGGYCPWSLNGTPIPNTSLVAAQGSAMGMYCDLNPSNSTSGPIQYQTIGTAPNRVFVVLYKGVTAFGCTSMCFYSSIHFYESTNIIEYHIGNKSTNCATWNGGLAIQGVANMPGNVATATAGRNNTVWTASQDGKRYSPTSPSNTSAYTVSTIPYIAVASNGSTGGTTLWQSTASSQTWPYGNGILTIQNVPNGTTGYFLTSSFCGLGTGSISDTTWITRVSTNFTVTSISDTCESFNGTLIATPGVGLAPFTFAWTHTGPDTNYILSQTTAIADNVENGTYSVLLTDGNGCLSTKNITVANVTPTFSATSTLVSCAGGNDGTATAIMSPGSTAISYLWSDPNAQTTQTATGLSVGTYTCHIISSNGCDSIVEVDVNEIPPLQATIDLLQNVSCYTGNDGFISVTATQGTSPYTYSWTGSASTFSFANDLFVGPQSVEITDSNGCILTIDTVLTEPDPLVIDFINPDTMICSESTLTIGAIGIGGSTGYTYTWYENGVQISTDQSLIVDPVNSNTVYSVILSEACGSPTATDEFTVVFPTDIVPNVTPFPAEACAPDSFSFRNISVNSGEIASTVYSFSNGAVQNTSLLDTAIQFFDIAGLYDVNMTVTSVYGCIYTGFFPEIINAKQKPKARFDMSSNPTTIFETNVKMFDKSIDAVGWEWTVKNASPEFSTSQNETFSFPQVEGEYPVFLKVNSALGCWDTVTNILNIKSDILFFTPNSFTPDGDEHNPTWKMAITGVDVANFELTMMNRWGEVLWKTYDPEGEWDGTFKNQLVPPGIYSWKARFKKNGTEEYQIETGTVTIVR